MENERLIIRKAEESDTPIILGLIKELAEYERMLSQVEADEDCIRNSFFAEKPAAECIIAFYDGLPAGAAIYFYNFSTFVGRHGLYLEDLFVKPHLRGKGIGKALLIHLARIAEENNCGRFEWAVLDWNEPAINFYKSLGAVPMDEWTIFRLSGSKLKELAEQKI